jgi:serine/threonine protein kinase, bacterial
MNRKLSWLTLAAAAWVLAACSSDNSSPSPSSPPPTTMPTTIAVSGAVVDGPVAGATISAYSISAAGVPSATALATTTTSATGSYSLTLPAATTGAILLTSTGGTFVDDVTGQTANAPALNAIIPDVSGATTVTAQLTPLTTIAAQLTLATASAGNSVNSVAAAINSALGTALGGQSDILGTPLVDVSTAGCATAASQASLDASLVLAGINQLAASNNVSSVDLIAAVVADLQSDNAFDGTANGVSLTVPLSGGTVLLCTIEGNCPGAPITGLAQQLGAAVTKFQASPANACGATESSSQQQAFAAAPPMTRVVTPYKYSYTLSSTLSGFSGSNAVNAVMSVALICPDDTALTTVGNIAPGFHGFAPISGNGTFSVVAGANGATTDGDYTVGLNAPDDCGANTWSLTFKFPSNLTCSVSGASSGTFTSNDGGNTNVAAAAPTVSCSPLYSVGGTIAGLNAPGLVLLDNGGDALPIASGATAFTFATPLATNAAYAVTVQSSPTGESCAISNGSGAVSGASVNSVVVTCTSSGGTGPGGPATTINGPGGMAFDANGNLWVTNSDGSTGSVLEFSITRDSSNNATALTQIGRIAAGISGPSRLAFDTAGNLYVTNIGTNRVTIYEPVNLTQIGTISSNIQRPLGVAVDASGTVYVADNSDNAVTVCTAPAGTLSATNSSFSCPTVLSGDGSVPSDAFSAPGALSYFAVPQTLVAQLPPGSPSSFLFVALGPSSGADSVLMYDKLPLESASTPFFDLSNGNNCSTGPSGPTAVAVSYDANDAAHPLLFYVASYYSSTIAAFDVLGIIENHSNLCPAPYASISGSGDNIAQPEGLAVDADRNVFVSDSSANHITVYNPGSSGTPAYRFTYSGGT